MLLLILKKFKYSGSACGTKANNRGCFKKTKGNGRFGNVALIAVENSFSLIAG